MRGTGAQGFEPTEIFVRCGPTRERDRVSRLRMQVVRNEFVEAFVTFVNEIKLDDAVRSDRLSFHCFERFQMLLQYWLETALHFCAGGYFLERLSVSSRMICSIKNRQDQLR